MKRDKVYLDLSAMNKLKAFIIKEIRILDSRIEFIEGLLNRKGYINKDYYNQQIGEAIKSRNNFDYMLYILNFNLEIINDIDKEKNLIKLDFEQLEI